MSKKLGQYFTVSEALQQFVFDHVKHKGSLLLEPSFGAGHLLKKFKEADPNYPMEGYEVDQTIRPVIDPNEHQTLVYGDFTTHTLDKKYRTIVGNPPYVKQRTGNLYIKFIELCLDSLEDDGELVFIVPSDFLKLTSASAVLTRMAAEGSFTDFLFPHDEKLFEGASIDVVVFRYEKGLHTDEARVNGEPQPYTVANGILTFGQGVGTPIGDRFHVYVGLVSGRDEVYRNDLGSLALLTDKDKVQNFIFPETFPTGNAAVDAHLLANKDALLARKIRAFKEENWFEWGAPRNLKSIRANLGKPCIYVRTMTRKSEVAFCGTVQHFGGTLLCLIPKGEEPLEKVVEFLNTPEFQKEYMYAGRFKIGHKQICNVLIPV